MPINNFKLFDEKKANMMSDDDYAINQQRLNGVQSGVASSQLQNKTLYQTALMCYALAQLMAANGYDANDADAVSTFVNNMSQTMVQKVVDKATDEDMSNKRPDKWVSAELIWKFQELYFNEYIRVGNGAAIKNGKIFSIPYVGDPKVILIFVEYNGSRQLSNKNYTAYYPYTFGGYIPYIGVNNCLRMSASITGRSSSGGTAGASATFEIKKNKIDKTIDFILSDFTPLSGFTYNDEDTWSYYSSTEIYRPNPYLGHNTIFNSSYQKVHFLMI